MRKTFALAAAPAALVLGLTACGNEANAPDDRIVDTGETDPNAVDVELPDVPVETPTAPITPEPEQSMAETPAE